MRGIPRRSRRADLGAAALGILGVALAAGGLFLDLFPLTELRDWSAIELTPKRARDHLENLFFREKLFSRDASILYSITAGEIAGTSIRGLNTLLLLPILGTCAFLFALARQLALPRLAGLAVVWLWAFSLPVVDAAAWQATIHDRLALLFSLACLSTALAALCAPGRLRSLLLGNGVAGLCLIGAYNSKESSFFLVPVLGLLVLLGSGSCEAEPPEDESSGQGRLRPLLTRGATLAAPLAYGLFHNLRYLSELRQTRSQGWSDHALGGEWKVNLSLASRHLLGLDRSDSPLLALGAWLLSAVLVGAAFVCARHRPTHVRGLAWITVAFVLSVILTLGAKGHPPYYQYLSRALLALLLVAAVVHVAEGSRTAARWRNGALAAALLANLGLLWAHSMPFYLELLRRSESFVGSLSGLRACEQPIRGDPIELVIPMPFWKVYRFYLGSEDGFYRFLFPGWEGTETLLGPQVRAEAEVDLERWSPAEPETLYLVFDERFALTELYLEGQRLACSPGPRPIADPDRP